MFPQLSRRQCTCSRRVARSRSDAPRLIVTFGTAFTIFGTIGGIINGPVVVGTGCTVAIITGSITIGPGVRISVGIVGGAGSTSSSRWATQ